VSHHQEKADLLRVGAVTYLNSKPLVCGLDLDQSLRLSFDLPSRLADDLSSGALDVALVPSIEAFRHPGLTVVSDACVACRAAVLSVKLYFRVPPWKVERIALDEGSRTSAALAIVLLEAVSGRVPEGLSLPIGADVGDIEADATLVIGDRAMRDVRGEFVEVWDLGQRWCQATELPFVFAMWLARPGVEASAVEPILAAARDRGLRQLDRIGQEEGPRVGVEGALATQYLRESLHYSLGERELTGLEQFRRRCAELCLIPADSRDVMSIISDGCIAFESIRS
jgi:chorismate dehydratase